MPGELIFAIRLRPKGTIEAWESDKRFILNDLGFN